MKPLLKVEELKIQFNTFQSVVKAVDNVTFEVKKGETVGLIGESGSGKTVTALSIMGLVKQPGEVKSGKIFFKDEDLVTKKDSEMNKIRGREIGMCFQNPRTALNPIMKVGDQIIRVYTEHKDTSKKQARERALDLLKLVNISDPKGILSRYPHQLSGGMCQRVMIVLALMCEPEFIILDEPTTGLDVTIQNQVLRLLKEIKEKTGVAQLFITHDLEVIAQTCQKIVVMYGGKIMEKAPRDTFFKNPLHPYSQALLNSVLELGEKGSIQVIPGEVPDRTKEFSGCVFHPRCKKSLDKCKLLLPGGIEVEKDHIVYCHLFSGDNDKGGS